MRASPKFKVCVLGADAALRREGDGSGPDDDGLGPSEGETE